MSSNIRDDVVSSAIEFLRHPSVLTSPLGRKISFLESKGLTLGEINTALAKVSTDGHPGLDVSPYLPTRDSPSSGFSWKKVFGTAIIAGGISVGVYRLLRKWLAIDSQEERVESSLVKLTTTTEKLLESVESQQKYISSTFEKIENDLSANSRQTMDTSLMLTQVHEELRSIQQSTIQDSPLSSLPQTPSSKSNLNASFTSPLSVSTPDPNHVLNDIQSDVRTLKSLLLNRHQFPLPTKSEIPPWQKDELKQDVTNNGLEPIKSKEDPS